MTVEMFALLGIPSNHIRQRIAAVLAVKLN